MQVSGIAPGAVQATTMSGASRLGGAGSEQRMQAAIGAAAQLFQMSPSAVAAAVGGGQSLSSLAAAKGISSSSLLDAVKAGIAQAAPQGSTGPSGALLDRIAGRIVNHTGGGHRHHRAGSASALTAPAPAPAAPATATATATSSSSAAGSPGAASGFDQLA